MFTPTALMNPTITAFETNRNAVPSFSSPAASITMPVRIESVNSADAPSDPCTRGTSAITIAIAPVPCTTMNADDAAVAPTIVPTR